MYDRDIIFLSTFLPLFKFALTFLYFFFIFVIQLIVSLLDWTNSNKVSWIQERKRSKGFCQTYKVAFYMLF